MTTGRIIDIIDPGGAEERSRERQRQADAAHEQYKRNRQVLEEIGKEVLDPNKMNKWRNRIKQAIKYFEGQNPEEALSHYWTESGDILRNINVIYLFLAMCYDKIISANLIITADLKRLNLPLFSRGVDPW